jgi:RNA polymerase sigma-70 factor (ECF subfamily)
VKRRVTQPGTDPLLGGLAAGDERAYEALYDRFGPTLYRIALGILGQPSDAEDAVQETFASVYRSRRRLPLVRDLKSYLLAALRRAASRVAAARDAASRPQLDPMGQRAPNDPADLGDRLEGALAALPLEQREVIALKVDGGFTFAEIAEVTGVSPNTAASRYRYALERLREHLGGPDSGGTCHG